MCNPALLLAAPQAILGLAESVQTYRAQEQAYADNKGAAIANYQRSIEGIGRQAVQAEQRQSEDTFDQAIESARERGRISASAADLGYSGSTTGQALGAEAFQAGRAQTITNINADNLSDQFRIEAEGAEIGRTSQINSVAKADKASLILGIGKAAMAGVNAYTGLGGRIPGLG